MVRWLLPWRYPQREQEDPADPEGVLAQRDRDEQQREIVQPEDRGQEKREAQRGDICAPVELGRMRRREDGRHEDQDQGDPERQPGELWVGEMQAVRYCDERVTLLRFNAGQSPE